MRRADHGWDGFLSPYCMDDIWAEAEPGEEVGQVLAYLGDGGSELFLDVVRAPMEGEVGFG